MNIWRRSWGRSNRYTPENRKSYVVAKLENLKSMTEEQSPDWEIPASDDETREDEGDRDAIPTRVLLLYKQIERDGFIEMETKEFRSVKSSGEATAGESVQKSVDVTERQCANEVVSAADLELDEETEKLQEKKGLAPSAFDYDEELDLGMDQFPRRTPKSDRKTRKRVGVFQDVVSDLKRYRELDAQGEKKDLPAETKSDKVDEEKESKSQVSQQDVDEGNRESMPLFTQQSSTSDIKEGMSSQLSNIENNLASQKPSEA